MQYVLLFQQLWQNLVHVLKSNQPVGVVVRDIVIRAVRGGSRGDVGNASSLLANFNDVFDEHSFSIISNLFDNNKPDALSAQ